MMVSAKRLLRWDARRDAQKDAIKMRLAVWRYQTRNLLAALVSPLPLPLPFLLRTAGTDKHQPKGHLYGRTYDRYFRKFRYQRLTLLEIGVGGYGFALGGQSLTAWRAYFPFANLVACDLHPRPGMGSRRLRIRQMDQSSVADLKRLAADDGPFDIVIDDGSHMSRHQILTFRHLFGALKDGGVYVIEDVMTSYWSFGGWDGSAVGHPDNRATCMGWFTELAHYVNHEEFEETTAANPDMLAFAPSIGHIMFEKNMIVIQKDQGTKGAVSIGRLKAIALRDETAGRAESTRAAAVPAS